MSTSLCEFTAQRPTHFMPLKLLNSIILKEGHVDKQNRKKAAKKGCVREEGEVRKQRGRERAASEAQRIIPGYS